MSYQDFENNLATFDAKLGDLGVRMEQTSLLGAQFALARKFLDDRKARPEDECCRAWGARFKEWHDAMIVVKRMTDACLTLAGAVPDGALAKLLRVVCKGSLTQDFEPDQAKDFFYELELASRFTKSGFSVSLDEPDIVISGNGLSGPVGIACKYPSSEKQMHPHISKGYRQIAKQGVAGAVAIGLDQIVFHEMAHFIDFREGGQEPQAVLQDYLRRAITDLVKKREDLYPSEDPINGCILTLWAYGVYGIPVQMTLVGAAQLQCDVANPRLHDFNTICQQLR